MVGGGLSIRLVGVLFFLMLGSYPGPNGDHTNVDTNLSLPPEKSTTLEAQHDPEE